MKLIKKGVSLVLNICWHEICTKQLLFIKESPLVKSLEYHGNCWIRVIYQREDVKFFKHSHERDTICITFEIFKEC